MYRGNVILTEFCDLIQPAVKDGTEIIECVGTDSLIMLQSCQLARADSLIFDQVVL